MQRCARHLGFGNILSRLAYHPNQGAEAAVAVISTQVTGQSKWRSVGWFADPENSADFNVAKNILRLGLDTGELPRDEDRTKRASGQTEKLVSG